MREICLDLSNGLPKKVDFGSASGETHFIRPEDIDMINADNTQVFIPVSGNCMERAGIEDGGYILVDFTRYPRPPRHKSKGGDGSFDCCLCRLMQRSEEGAVGVKAYDGKWGTVHCVSTRHTEEGNPHPPFQAGLFAEKVYGAVIASYGRDGGLLWERDPEEFPRRLDEKPSIFGDGIGDPVFI